MEHQGRETRKSFFIGMGTVVVLVVLVSLWLNVFKEQPSPAVYTQPASVEEELALQEIAGGIIKTGNLEGCDSIDNHMYRSVCRNNIALNLAQEKLDISYCNEIDDKLVSRDSCERQVISRKSVLEENIDVCNSATSEELVTQCRNQFWIGLAFAKQDLNICLSASIEDEKARCNDTYLLQNEFMTGQGMFDCKRFMNEDAVSDCVTYTQDTQEGLADSSTDVCSSLKSPLFSNFCLLNRNQGMPQLLR